MRDSKGRGVRVGLPTVSVRTRLIAVITIVAAFGLGAVGVVVYVEERQRILAQVDDLLVANLAAARYLVEQGDEGGTWESADAALATVVQRAAPDDNTGVIGLRDDDVALVPGVALDVDLQSTAGFVPHIDRTVTDAQPRIGTYATEEITWRYLAVPIAIDADAPPASTFVIAYDIDAELAEINSAARVFLIASGVVLVVIAGVGAVVATRLLRPLRQMRETAERVSVQSLSERLPIVGRDDVSELAHTMNDMLDRLDRALSSQRQLLSDVGHELKTPITIVRGNLEVVDRDDPEDVRETIDLAVDELDRMADLVRELASTAALHGPTPITATPVDAADLMRQVLRKAQSIDGGTVTGDGFAEIVTSLDPARVTQAVLQLVQNGVTHGGGQVTLGTRLVEDHLDIVVRDRGPGVPEESRAFVFDRFHRGAEAASRPGNGLGLNIVQVIARAHGGSVSVEDADGGGARFVMTLPLVMSDSVHPGLVIPPRPPLPADVDTTSASTDSEIASARGA
ncbi:sensor histidine kinase [Microbacterium koreense]|uniref:histidine kinase n=1 Tax=Microbacterium koreense TaxID=323761 RepID=A0ABW2ZPJ0_9MICO